MTNVKHNNRGMSLIEVLVVMMILVIGIFAVATVFPQGFRFIEHSRNVTFADRLCQAEVERWKAYAANVPDGIEAMNAVDGSVWDNYNPDDMSNATSIPAGDSPWLWSNVNRVRQVKGEVTLIPTATLLPYGTGGNYAFSLYNLKMAPIVFSPNGQGNHPAPQGTEWPDQYVLVYGDPQPSKDVTGLSGDDLAAALDNLDRQTYGVDYTSGRLYFEPIQWSRKFKVEYSYWEGNILKNNTEIITVPGGQSDTVKIQLAHQPLDDFSERVSRKFDYVAPGSFDRFNPYQFTLLNNYSANSFAPTIAFNPVGQNRTVRTNLGSRPLKAHIDYEVQDWHVIHEDRTVPSPGSVDPTGYVIRLTLPGIKVAGRRENDINALGSASGTAVNLVVYKGLTPALPGVSVVGLDMTDNTLMMDSSAGGLIVDYATGIVRVPAAVTKYTAFGGELKNQDIRGHDVRFFYQATGDWAVQVSKAWSNYQRRDVGVQNLANLQYNNFDVEIVQPGAGISQIGYSNDTSDVCAVLIFPRSNAGHAIAASLIWNDVNNTPHEITGHQDKLPEFALVGTGFPYMAIRLAPPDRFQPNNTAAESWKNPYFTFVQGASLKVRTIWREDPRRWESRDMETFLNRK
jgi:prepilin-type N-terminal cleavage/methylation domain-containing protein